MRGSDPWVLPPPVFRQKVLALFLAGWEVIFGPGLSPFITTMLTKDALDH